MTGSENDASHTGDPGAGDALTAWPALSILPPDPNALFSLIEPPRRRLPYFFNSPHSGDCFPGAFLERSQLRRDVLRRASDLYIDALFMPLVPYGVPLMRAHFPRSYLDLNREAYELDPRLIEGALPPYANTRSLRVLSGLGTIPRLVGDGAEIYAGKLSFAEAAARIEAAYLPYHHRLTRELGAIYAEFGEVVLFDCHSMPSAQHDRDQHPLPDLVLGDRFGTSCDAQLIDLIEQLARNEGLHVQRNRPYAGGFITEHYGRPTIGWHALQIEINRALYMDEERQLPHAGFEPLMAMLEKIFTMAFVSRRSGLHFSQRAAE